MTVDDVCHVEFGIMVDGKFVTPPRTLWMEYRLNATYEKISE
jgi:hypothetical protein